MSQDQEEIREPLDPEELALVAALTADEVESIDRAILQAASPRWAKVARIVGGFLRAQPGIPADIPLEFVWERLCLLVERGELEAQGDLRGWRSSEVRLL